MTAAERPIPNWGPGSDRVYLRHGLSPRLANTRRAAGIPATVAKAFQNAPTESYLPWLSTMFSVVGLRSLAERNMLSADAATLMRLAETNLTTLRGYVSQTRLSVSDIDWMMTRGVSCQSTLTWTRRLPHVHRDTNLVSVLRIASIVHSVSDEDLSGWVRYTNRHQILFPGMNASAWQFLGGDTALMALAGLTPTEASRMTRQGAVDREALAMLAGLRAGTRGVR